MKATQLSGNPVTHNWLVRSVHDSLKCPVQLFQSRISLFNCHFKATYSIRMRSYLRR